MEFLKTVLVLSILTFSSLTFSEELKIGDVGIDDPTCALNMMEKTLELKKDEISANVSNLEYILQQVRYVRSNYLNNRDPNNPTKNNGDKFRFINKSRSMSSLVIALNDSDNKEVILEYQSMFGKTYVKNSTQGGSEYIRISTCPDRNPTLYNSYFSMKKSNAVIYEVDFYDSTLLGQIFEEILNAPSYVLKRAMGK